MQQNSEKEVNQEIYPLTGHPGVRLKTSTDDKVKPPATGSFTLNLHHHRPRGDKALMWRAQCATSVWAGDRLLQGNSGKPTGTRRKHRGFQDIPELLSSSPGLPTSKTQPSSTVGIINVTQFTISFSGLKNFCTFIFKLTILKDFFFPQRSSH